MSKVLVKIRAEVINADSLETLGTFRVTDVSDLQTGDEIARAIDCVLEVADDATKWEKINAWD
jgi:hypothetical protein